MPVSLLNPIISKKEALQKASQKCGKETKRQGKSDLRHTMKQKIY
jgi:hypothetical protein